MSLRGLHGDARELLASWAAPDSGQEALRRRYVEHLDSRPDAMSRDCRPDHLTASTLVLDAAGSRALLTLHAKAGRWFQLGGHCEDGDATLAAAALREAREESGLAELVLDPVPVHLSEHAVPFCGGTADGLTAHHLDVRFVAVVPDVAEHSPSAESLDLRWWPVEALPDPDPGLLELTRLARARLGRRTGPGTGQSTSDS